MLTDGQRRIIGLLIELARAADRALDDSEERIGDDGRFHAINGPDFDELSDALEKLEELPDDKPGETLGAGGKAEWALRSILAGAAPHDATMSTDEQARADRDLLLYGESFMVDGKRVSPERVRLQCAPSVKAVATSPTMSEAARDVLAERRRQVDQEGWTPAHDDGANDVAAMADAAACYAMHAGQMLAGAYSVPCTEPRSLWPWDKSWWKPTTPRRDLVKAGALILAEIERLDRAAAKGGSNADA